MGCERIPSNDWSIACSGQQNAYCGDLCLFVFWLLIQANDVSSGITKAGGDLGSVGADGLNNLTTVFDDQIGSRLYAIHHDVKKQTGPVRRRPPNDPCSTDLADAIIKGDTAITTSSHIPAEDLFVEFGRTSDIGCGHFHVADFSVRKCRRHRGLLSEELQATSLAGASEGAGKRDPPDG